MIAEIAIVLDKFVATVQMEEIPPEFILNSKQTEELVALIIIINHGTKGVEIVG